MQPVTWLMIAVAGAIIGSFLNVVIYRGPTMWGLVGDDRKARGGLISPSSRCPACKAPIAGWRLIPIASYFLQRGRCANCGAPISRRYPVIEAGGGVIALIAAGIYGLTAEALLLAVFGWALLALTAIDLETGYLPDAVTLPLLGLGLIASLFGVFAPFWPSLIGASAGYLSFRLIGEAFFRLRGREGLGEGDAKLIAAIGAFGGWTILAPTVFVAALATLLMLLMLSPESRRISRDAPIPFGPGLCAAGFAALALRDALPIGP